MTRERRLGPTIHLEREPGKPWCFTRAKSYDFGPDSVANCGHCFGQRKKAPGPNQLLTCSRCKKEKHGSEFPNNACKPTGKVPYCTPCRSEKQSADREAKRDMFYAREQRSRAKNREPARVAAKRNNDAKPKAVYARGAVRNEVKHGRLVRGPCEVCGTTKNVRGHHDDYDKPLEVRWLCSVHHTEWHEANGPGANIDGPCLYWRAANGAWDETG